MAVNIFREKRLIPRVHLLDAMTKVVALWTKRKKWLSPYFQRDAWSREFIFWMQWTRDWPWETPVTTLQKRRLIPIVHLLDAVTKVVTFRIELEKRLSPLFERRLIPRVHILDTVTKVVALRIERGKWLSARFERDAWSREFTFCRRLILSVHLLDAVKKVVALRTERGKRLSPRFERDAWSREFTFWMQWRRSLHSGLTGENGSHHASRETPDPESSPFGCSNVGRCTTDWTGKWLSTYFERDPWSREFTFWMQWRRSLHYGVNGKNGCQHISRETPDPESSPSACIDEGRCIPDWKGKTAVTTLRERRLIPRVHLLDAVTKVVELGSPRFKRDVWSQ